MFGSRFGASLSATPSSASKSGGSGGQNGSARQTDPRERYFKRQGFEIVELPAAEIPDHSAQAKDVAFCITDTDEPLNEEIRANFRIAIFSRERNPAFVHLGEYFDGGGRFIQTEDEAEGVELRGFGVDSRPDGKGVNFSFTRGGHLRDLHVRGEGDANQKWGCGIYCRVPRGERMVLENVRQPDGASRNFAVPSVTDSIGTILTGYSHGVLEMRECEYGGFPNNGIYASGPTKQGYDGHATIDGHVGYNSDRDQIRIGDGSVARNCECYTDHSKPGFNNHRGVWVRWSNGALVENCSIQTHTHGTAAGVYIDGTAGHATVRDCDIEVRSSDPRSRGILAMSPTTAGENFDTLAVRIEGGRIYGDAPTKDAILIQFGRPDSSVAGVTFDCPNAADLVDNRN